MESGAPQLRAIAGGRDFTLRLGNVMLRPVTADAMPFVADALVREEDTFRVFGSSGGLHAVQQHPIRTFTDAYTTQALAVGSAVFEPGSPANILAVIHDLDSSPSCETRWVQDATTAVMELAEEHQLTNLCMPLLGTVHGRLLQSRALEILHAALVKWRGSHPRRVALTVAAAELDDVRGWLMRQQ